MSLEPKLGEVYEVSHTRKGNFTIKVTCIDEEWVEGVVVDGEANAILQGNVKGEGEKVSLRKSFCNFYLPKSEGEVDNSTSSNQQRVE